LWNTSQKDNLNPNCQNWWRWAGSNRRVNAFQLVIYTAFSALNFLRNQAEDYRRVCQSIFLSSPVLRGWSIRPALLFM